MLKKRQAPFTRRSTLRSIADKIGAAYAAVLPEPVSAAIRRCASLLNARNVRRYKICQN